MVDEAAPQEAVSAEEAAPVEEPAPAAEPEPEPTPVEEAAPQEKVEEPAAKEEEAEEPVRRRRSPSPVAREERRSPPKREKSDRVSTNYDYEKVLGPGRIEPPVRQPTYISYSSYMPAENMKYSYNSYTPYVSNLQRKYQNEYTASSNYRPKHDYTREFDNYAGAGAFGGTLYAQQRYAERSRARSRERQRRSARSASSQYRYYGSSAAGSAVRGVRPRDLSSPASLSRSTSRQGSFTSFLDYSLSKQYDLSRQSSRVSNAGGLSRSGSVHSFLKPCLVRCTQSRQVASSVLSRDFS